jgi:hypothetical protein
VTDTLTGHALKGTGHVSKVIIGARLAEWSRVAGQPLVPGTLNVAIRSVNNALKWLGEPTAVTEPDGSHGALRWWPVTLTIHGNDYPAHVVRVARSSTRFLEIVAPVHFRSRGVIDGTPVTIRRSHATNGDNGQHAAPVAAPAVIVANVPPAPRVIGREERALILGGAACVWDDVKAVEALLGHEWHEGYGLVIAVNNIGVHWPRPLDHWCTLHTEKLGSTKKTGPGWLEQRTIEGHPGGYLVWTRKGKQRPGVTNTVSAWSLGGSSGLLGIEVAQTLGVRRAILCGIPMDKSPHFAESRVHPPTKPWIGAGQHLRVWKKNLGRIQGWVRSMSGQTREMFGGPTEAWINGSDDNGTG